MQQLSLGFSPCPNDTFIFDALIHGKIDTEGLAFEVIMEDVEALNKKAFQGDIHITKLSYHAFAHLTESYNLLNSGSALGKNCGPLLIAKEFMNPEQINRASIAIPGAMTTANFLLGLAYPGAKNKTAVLFSEIEDSVLSGQYEAGLIIHENRFTYEQKGLKKLIDLGEYWESSTGFPIPLGGIVINRALSLEIQQKVNRALKKSVEYAFANQDDVMPFVRQHAQEMDEAVMRAHINLYVNNFSIDLGEAGKQAIMAMFNTAREKGLIPGFRNDFFVPV
ncbi:MAG: 1,4-dihydroxy-6-naphthoate synthase [Saprospiraceae bacterium]